MEKEHIMIGDLAVEVWWKPIKNFNLVVHAPDGRVRISVPRMTSAQCVQQFVVNRMAWIIKQRNRFRARSVETPLRMVSGERHLFMGKQYSLEVLEGSVRHFVEFDQSTGITLHVRSGTTTEARFRLLDSWYRAELKSRVLDLLAIWEDRVGQKAKEFRIKRMKTRWGTCNIGMRRLWLNLELVKKSEECLELILVHELVHLLERDHNEKFYAHMDRLLPRWRAVDNLLKGAE